MLLLTVMWPATSQDVLGRAYSGTASDEDHTSITFALAKNRYIDHEDWLSPVTISSLQTEVKPGPNPVETADEVPSETEYYDGSVHLRGNSVCSMLLTEKRCEEKTGCVWCEGGCLARYRECGETQSFLLD